MLSCILVIGAFQREAREMARQKRKGSDQLQDQPEINDAI